MRPRLAKGTMIHLLKHWANENMFNGILGTAPKGTVTSGVSESAGSAPVVSKGEEEGGHDAGLDITRLFPEDTT